ncbi:hypothetical protein LTR08_004412 [Meristemomyces frigidus]|nr:hypothetical protein LTR08_004412 [Meristemomyces frigidus]
MPTLLTVSAALALPFLTGVNAFWRMNCAIINTGRIDPLVNPGAVSAHTHTIVGGSNIGVNSTGASLVDSKCSSCEIQADKSAYWSPLLFYNYPNGSFIEVPHDGSVVYYIGRAPAVNITPFPEGFMMLSGNKAARSYDHETMTWGNAEYPGVPVSDRVTFVCLTAGAEPPQQHYMFTPTQCINGMRAQIAFQSCWNGVDLYKSDNSHVAYLTNIDGGICPPGYPVQLPLIFIETLYSPATLPGAVDDSRFVFSQGDPTGYGFHADFQNEMPSPINETVLGLLDNLPGCIEITYGPDAAPASSMDCPTNIRAPAIIPTIDSVPRPTSSPIPDEPFGLPEQTYMGCYNDSDFTFSVLNSLAITNYTVMTVEWCQQYCMNNGYIFSGVESAQECHCDNAINPTALNTDAPNQCTWDCGGTLTADEAGTQELCGGLGAMDVFRNTNASFRAFGNNASSAGQAQGYEPLALFASNYLGCYRDVVVPARTLDGPILQQNNMTIEMCEAFCQLGVGYQYYGLEYSTQCYCGNYIIAPNFLLTPDTSPSNSTCGVTCAGASSELCGGSGAMSLYNNTAFTLPVVLPSVGRYRSGDCLTDRGPVGVRALAGAGVTDSVHMTVERCIKFCLGKYMHYAGVEYGAECYCANEITVVSGVEVAQCNATDEMLCSGSQFEYCGGSGFMNLYYSDTL